MPVVLLLAVALPAGVVGAAAAAPGAGSPVPAPAAGPSTPAGAAGTPTTAPSQGPAAPSAAGGDAGGIAGEGVAGAGAAPALAAPPGGRLAAQVETDRVRLLVAVRADGTAEWRVQYWTELDDENTTEAFESLQADVRANPDNYTDRFASRIRRTVSAAENATGRSMTVRNVSVATKQRQLPGGSQNGFGVVAYEYEWTGFAAVSEGGDRLVVGDAIEGFFLERNTFLEVRWPTDYRRVSVDPAPDSESASAVAWEGSRTDFLSGQPSVVVDRSPPGTTGTTTDGQNGTNTAGGPGAGNGGDGGGFPSTAALALVVVALAAGGGYLLYARSDGRAPAPGASTGSPAGAGAGGEAAGRPGDPHDGDGAAADPDDAGAADGEGDGAADAGDATGPGAAGSGGDATDGPAGGESAEDGSADDESGDESDDGEEPPPIDEELLSNEERVLRLLERRGGRVKQQEVVEALDWTEAKTSQVVSGMRDEGTIDGFRLGRENVLTLPEEDDGPLGENGGDGGDRE